MKGSAKELICITCRHRQQFGDGQRGGQGEVGGGEMGGGWQKGENGDICNGVNNKNKEKK